MSIEQSHAHSRGTTVLSEENNGVYGALFGKINLRPVKVLGHRFRLHPPQGPAVQGWLRLKAFR